MKLRTEPNQGTRTITLSQSPETKFYNGICDVPDDVAAHLMSIDCGIKFIPFEPKSRWEKGEADKPTTTDAGEDLKVENPGEDLKQGEVGEDIQKKSEEAEPLATPPVAEVVGEVKAEVPPTEQLPEPPPLSAEEQALKDKEGNLRSLKVDELKEIAAQASEALQDGVDVQNLKKAELVAYLIDKV